MSIPCTKELCSDSSRVAASGSVMSHPHLIKRGPARDAARALCWPSASVGNTSALTAHAATRVCASQDPEQLAFYQRGNSLKISSRETRHLGFLDAASQRLLLLLINYSWAHRAGVGEPRRLLWICLSQFLSEELSFKKSAFLSFVFILSYLIM